MSALQQLAAELGNPGVQALWLAARRAGLEVSKKEVTDFVRRRGEKQIFGAVQPARGKTMAPTPDGTLQMDLADMKNNPEVRESDTYKFFLVVVNAFDRVTYARNLKTKTPREVREALESILASLPRKPKVISSDSGSEFHGPVSDLLADKGIAQRFKAVGDVNALGLVDRAVQTLKAKIAEISSRSRQTWPNLLQQAVSSVNSIPKPVLLGDAPEEVRDDDEVVFQLLQQQARNFKHNQQLTEKRQAKLQDAGAFRAPLPGSTSKFKRGFQATYGDVQRVQSVRGGTVTATDGSRHSVKQVRTVPVGSSAAEASFGRNTGGPARKKQRGALVLDALEDVLQGEDRVALSKAAQLMRARLKNDGQDYDELLKQANAKLIDLIRLAPDRFELVSRPNGRQTWYFVSLAD